MRQQSLHPGDVVVALQLALRHERPLSEVAAGSARSIGEVHNAIARLRSAGLVDPDTRLVEREPLLQFIRWGVAYSFPPTIGGSTVGVATASLDGNLGGTDGVPAQVEFVWPSSAGTSRGAALVPLHPRVPELAEHNPRLYVLLAAVDLIRVGGARERAAASAHLARLLAEPAAHE